MAFSDEERTPQYEGEDVSPTTERELKGWYYTGLAAEIFAVCGVGMLCHDSTANRIVRKGCR